MGSRGLLSSGIKESLCCCEYENLKGERSHIMACCCDCEAFDETCDKLLKCQSVPSSTLDRLFETVADRCRIPFCSGQGARKIQPDIIIPIILVPSCLFVATLHPITTVLAFLFMPFFIIIFTAAWRHRDKNRRTPFFFAWAVTSVVTCYCVFQFFVVAFREVLLWEILLVFTMTAALFYLLHQIRKDSGQLKNASSRHKLGHKRTASNVHHAIPDTLYDQMNGQEKPNPKLYDGAIPTDMVTVSLNDPQDSQVQWVDSRTVRGGRVETYCEDCSFHKPPRVGHCNICRACVAVRDHHCIWIDSCVGATNHRSFLTSMILFIVTSLYASHLTFTTICTPEMYFDWFLLPNDCRWLYGDFLTAISFVTAIYAMIVSGLVSIGLVFQCILISQNLTSHELAQAWRQGLTRYGLFAVNNLNNKGFIRNWMEFWFLDSRMASSKIPS